MNLSTDIKPISYLKTHTSNVFKQLNTDTDIGVSTHTGIGRHWGQAGIGVRVS